LNPTSQTTETVIGKVAPSRTLLVLLVIMTAAAPVALQIYLPALPAVQKAFGVSAGVAQLTLSLSILANAVATLLYGPLSDRYGRRPVLIAGLMLFSVGSLAAGFTDSINTLIAARLLQSAGAASGMVLARAIVRDLYDREYAASAIAYLTTAMVAAPMFAPTVGAILTDLFGWRSTFYVLTIIAASLTWLTWRHLVETRAPAVGAGGWSGLFTGAGTLVRRPMFIGYLLQSSFAISAFISFLSGAPYFMVDILGRTATEYALYFIMVPGCFMLGNFVSARLVHDVGMDRLILIGTVLAVVGVGTGMTLFVSGIWWPIALFGTTAIGAIGNGLSISNAMAGAVSIDPKLAGTASGLCGFSQMFLSAILSQIVGTLQNGTPYPMLIAMLLCAVLSLISILVARHYDQR
jgi:DHA1 family bicyclomycin/chloramphenicol resistance-like MFS transporter